MKQIRRTILRLETLEARIDPSGVPINLMATTASPSEVNLTWDLTGAADTAVVIQRAIGASGTYQVLATLPGGSDIFTDTSCWAGTLYSYRVQSQDATGNSAFSAISQATTQAIPTGAMAMVTGLQTVAASPTTDTVSFIDTNTGVAQRYYFVERSSDGVSYQVVASLDQSTSWQDTGLTPGATYSYRVRGASWTEATSDYTPPVAITLPARPISTPVEPSGLQAVASSGTSVTITWTNNDPSGPQFKVERAAYNAWNPMTWTQVGLTAAGATSFVDTGLTAERAYVYRVRATNAAGNSGYALPATDLMHSLFGTAVGVDTASAGTGSPKTYDIGPGYLFQNIGDLNWTQLGPGDTVNIHYKPGGYHELFQISTRGTAAAWITINGVPDPVTGALPVIDGYEAVLAPQFVNHYSPLSGSGGIVVGARPGYADGYNPGYLLIQNLQVQDIYQGNADPTFKDFDGTTKTYGLVGAGIYLERGDHITIKDCVVTNNGEGIFGAGQSSFERLMANVTLDGNSIYGNGDIGRDTEHNTYLEGIDTLYQYNHYGPLRPGAFGAGLKDRSVGLVIRYNYIEGGAHQLQLPEAENENDLAVTLPEYHTTYVYGNTLVAPPGDASSIIYFGGDEGLTPYYRKGILYLYNNTLVARSDQSQVYHIMAVQLATTGESLDARNNIFSAIPNTAGGLRPDFGLLGNNNNAYFGRNWVPPGYLLTTYGFTGHAAGLGNLLVGSSVDPGFASLAGGDYHLAAGSAAIDASTRLAGATAPYPVNQEYVDPHSGQVRAVVGAAPDLGSEEYQGASLPAPVTVTGILVNDGSAERSEVRSIAVTFSGPVNFAGGNANAAAAFQLQHVTDALNVALAATVSTDAQGRTVVTLTFFGPETDTLSAQNGGKASLADGRYTLAIASASVTGTNGLALDGDVNGIAGGNYISPTDSQGGGVGQLHLYRIFGDTNGDGIVDQVDLGQFRGSFNASPGSASYLAYLDSDNTGTLDQLDLGQFRSRFNTNVFPTLGPGVSPVPPTALSVEVNDGNAQRSEVRSVTVTFSGPVAFSGGQANAAAAFQLKHLTNGNDVGLAATVSLDNQGRTVVTLSFSGTETDRLSAQNGGIASLADGRYQLTIFSGSVTGTNGLALDGDANGNAGGNYVSPTDAPGGTGRLHLFRLFGDANGDGSVDAVDLGQFRKMMNASVGDPSYLSFLDADNCGFVGQVDLGQFRSRFNANVW